MVKWVLNHRNILSEWQCLVCKPKSQQEHFIVASMETTKLILAWFTSTRERGNFVENCKSKIWIFFGNHDWEAVIKLTIGAFKALLAKCLGDLEKNVPKNENMDEFLSQLFHFPFFFYGEVSSKSEEYFIRMTMCGM